MALRRGETIELLAVGGVVMVLAYDARLATHDVDVVLLQPNLSPFVRDLVKQIADELEWPIDWLNDGAKGFLTKLSDGGVIYTAPGIIVYRPTSEQMLAMKLSAWRDDVDIQDARRLLRDLVNSTNMDQEAHWSKVEPFVVPGQQLKARYAFLDLWESIHDDD